MNHKVAYTLRTHSTTGERHLFVGTFTPNDLMHKCKTNLESVCKEVKKDTCLKNPGDFDCKNEQEARELCSKIGRSVCANCIQELYKTL